MKKVLTIFGQIAISAILIGFLLSRMDFREFYNFFVSIPLSAIAGVLLFGFINVSLQALRFIYVSRNILPPFSMKQGCVAHFSGFLFRLLLPASIGEVGKMFLLPGSNKERIYAFMVDSFFAVGTMFFFVGIGSWLLFPAKWYLLGISLIPLLLFIIYRFLSRSSYFKDYIPDHVPLRKIGIANILLTVLSHIAFVFQYWSVLASYGMKLFEQAKACFFILGITAVPISFSGIGVREGGAQWILQRFLIPPEVAVGTAFFVFFANVLLPAFIAVILLNFFSEVRFHHIRDRVKKMINKEKE